VITGVIMVVGGAYSEESNGKSTNIFGMICLIMQPIMLAGGFIALRKMKNNHTMIVSAYVNLCLMILCSIILIVWPGINIFFFVHLNVRSWLLFGLAALLTIAD
jgi:drug/metabolite transporter (DMT)-like permease